MAQDFKDETRLVDQIMSKKLELTDMIKKNGCLMAYTSSSWWKKIKHATDLESHLWISRMAWIREARKQTAICLMRSEELKQHDKNLNQRQMITQSNHI